MYSMILFKYYSNVNVSYNVCSMLEFCLQCAEVLFAGCWSFVCRVLKFCLQGAEVLFAGC